MNRRAGRWVLAYGPAMLFVLGIVAGSRRLHSGMLFASLVAWAVVGLWAGVDRDRAALLEQRVLGAALSWRGVAVAAALLIGALAVAPWAVVALSALAHFTAATERPKFTAFGLLLSIPLMAVALEGVLWKASKSVTAAKIPGVRALARELHRVTWNVVQYQPDCAQGDEELLYTLRPGRCVFADVEFAVPLEVNRLGVRDDEASLNGPEIIVAGDSHAMGWGITAEETFATLVERRTGRKVLNMAIPSYGTARELTFLKRADLSRARYLIIQYNANDFEENAVYIQSGYQLRRHTAGEHERTAAGYAEFRKYWFGRYLSLCFGQWLDVAASRAVTTLRGALSPVNVKASGRGTAQSREMDALFDVIAHSPVDLSRLKILLIAMTQVESMWDTADRMNAALASRADRATRLSNITVVNALSGVMDARQDYFPLDGHTNAHGHAKVASVLEKYLREP